MDWSPRETFLAPDGLDDFEYDVEADLPMTVMHKFNPEHGEDRSVEMFEGMSDEPGFWEKLKDLPLFKYKRVRWAANPKSPPKLPSGLCIFFCPRANSVFDDIPSDLSDLCLPRDEWENIAKRFCLNNLLVKAIRQKITSISVEPHHLTKNDQYGETGDNLLMCTVTTSSPGSSGGGEFAISSTHFKKAGLTVAAVLGATPEQVSQVQALLEIADEAIGHPLLMLGLAAELMLGRLVNPVEQMRDQCIRNVRLSREMLFVTDRKGTNYAMDVESIRSESLWLDEAVKTTKHNLEKALAVYNRVNGTIDDDDGESDSATKPESGEDGFEENLKRYVEHKMKVRFQDIFAQLDGLIAVTRISVQDMCSMSTTIMGELNRRDAADSAQTAKTGTLIAFLAMLYLPITSVATIFATPVFNFQNDWRDWRFQPTSSSPDDQSDSPSGPVFSGYFWIYIGVSIALTFLTMEGWWRVAGLKPQETGVGNGGPGGGAKSQPRSLPHWTLYPIWSRIEHFFPRKRAEAETDGEITARDESDDERIDESPSIGSAGGLREKGGSGTFNAAPLGPGGSCGSIDPSESPARRRSSANGAPEVEREGTSANKIGTVQQALFRFTAPTRRKQHAAEGSSAISAV